MAKLARLKLLIVPTLLGSLAGFLASFLLPAQYSARSVIEESPPRQYDFWGPVNTRDSEQKLATFQEQVISLNNLRPLILRDGIAKPSDVEGVHETIRKNTTLKFDRDAVASPTLPVDLIYTDSTPQRAEEICSILTSAALEKTRVDEQEAVAATTDFLQRSLKEAENDMQALHNRMLSNPADHKLAVEYAKARESYADLSKKANMPQVVTGGTSNRRGIGVVLPCASLGSPDFPNRILCAAIGLAIGLIAGTALIAGRRKTGDFVH